MIPLEKAKGVAKELVDLLQPHFELIKVVGSVRRQKPLVNDIDLVAIPGMVDPRAVLAMLPVEIVRSGPKLAAFKFQGVDIDLYYATPETWGTLLLIRTGPKESNIRLCTLAQNRGWKLKASGEGLFDSGGTRIAGDTEESIFRALGLRYEEPEARGKGEYFQGGSHDTSKRPNDPC
jgi:DNA polymerase (family 10)